MSKKIKVVIVFVVAVVIILSGIFLWRLKEPGLIPSPTYRVEYTLEETPEGWFINITNTIKEYGGASVYEFKAEHVRYKLFNPAGYLVDPFHSNASSEERIWKTIADINGTQSSRYNITWNDMDNDGMLSIGDNFFISKTGGTDGVAESGYGFELWFGGCLLMAVRL